LDQAQVAATLAAQAALFLGAAFGEITAPLVVIGQLLFQVVYESLEFIGADVWTEDFDEKFVCILYNCASSSTDVVHFDFECVTNGLAQNTDIADLTFAELRLFGQLIYILNFIGGSQALDAAGATDAVSDPDCSACEEVCERATVVAIPGTTNGSITVLENGKVRVESAQAPNGQFQIAIEDAEGRCWQWLNVVSNGVPVQGQYNFSCAGAFEERNLAECGTQKYGQSNSGFFWYEFDACLDDC